MQEMAILQPFADRLLCVDDNEDITDLLEELGEEAGYDVRTVNQFELITQEIESFNPSVIFLDLNLE